MIDLFLRFWKRLGCSVYITVSFIGDGFFFEIQISTFPL